MTVFARNIISERSHHLDNQVRMVTDAEGRTCRGSLVRTRSGDHPQRRIPRKIIIGEQLSIQKHPKI